MNCEGNFRRSSWLNLAQVAALLAATAIIAPCTEGRKFGRCELAAELLKHKIPRYQLANWLCIAQHESLMDTGAINRYNTDGSSDHGLFQINDRYWCSPGGANVCKIQCHYLRDEYIGDDVVCAKTIYKVHGYSAWVAWSRYCQHKNLDHFMRGCRV